MLNRSEVNTDKFTTERSILKNENKYVNNQDSYGGLFKKKIIFLLNLQSS